MKKIISKTVLECILYIALLFIPFVFANYFITDYYLDNNRFLWDFDALLLTVLKWISVIVVAIFIRKKKQSVILENSDFSKKIFWISFVIWIILTISVNWGEYPDVYGMISSSLGFFDNWPLLLAVTWEQYLDGTFFSSILLCVVICFFNRKYFKKS